MTLTEIANRIYKHLQRFEKDPEINKPNPKYKTRPYYHASASRAGRYVKVRYISYQHSRSLTREEAEAYLKWLDEGNVGKHFNALESV